MGIKDLTPEQLTVYNEALEVEIAKYRGKEGFNEEIFKQMMEVFVFDERPSHEKFSNAIATGQVGEAWHWTGVWIADDIVASGLNMVISALVGGAVISGIKALVKKYGVIAATDKLIVVVVKKLGALGVSSAGQKGINKIVRKVVDDILDPGSVIANWLDDNDGKPNNGRVDIWD